MTMKAMYLKDGYGRNKRGLDGWYRTLTIAEAKKGLHRSYYAVDLSGNVREIRQNGKPKTWKRSPGCEVAFIYGLRDHFRVGCKNRLDHESLSTGYWQAIVLVRVSYPFDENVHPGVVADYVMDHELKV